MKKYLYIFMSCLLVVLTVSCGGNSNSIEPKQLKQDKTKWFVNDDGEIQQCMCYSDEYYMIDSRKIALVYTFAYWPTSQFEQMKYACSFSFVDKTDEDGETRVVPSFNTNENAKLPLIWEDGQSGTLTIDKVQSSSLTWWNPWSFKFQKLLNERKKFSVSITLSDGKNLRYHFDISQRGDINI